jgi:hypothetical protein
LRLFGGGRLRFVALLLVAVIVVTSEVEVYYYYQSIYLRRSSEGQSGRGSSGSGNRSGTGPVTNPNFISVSTLINYGNGTSTWYNETNVPASSNFYNLTVSIAYGNVVAQYYPTLNAHYIISINGVSNNNDGIHCDVCWTLWVYCKGDRAWSVSLLGADLITLKNGDVLAWYIQNISQSPWRPPQAGSNTVAVCSS